MRAYDYKCATCTCVTEVFTREVKDTTECPACGQTAERQLAAPRSKLEGWSGAFPTASDKWARMHVEAAKPKKSDL